MEVVPLGLDRRIGEDAGGLLEGGRGEEGVGLKGSLGDAEDERVREGRTLAVKQRRLVLARVALKRHAGAGEKRGFAAIDDDDFAEHLTDDDLKVLIRDADALSRIDLLNLFDHVDLELRGAIGVLEQLLRVDRAVGDLSAGFDVVTLLDPEP